MNRTNIINHIQETCHFTKYLEIGVSSGECFKNITSPIKHSVDPGYEYSGVNPATYPFESDSFFNKLEANQLDLPPDFKWDIIFIDGLHLAPQVERDFLNSLNHLSENGVIVLHDCNPFLYENNYRRTIEDNHGGYWNGTVWKTIYKLKTSRSDLNICTVNIDEGVGLIKRGSQDLIPFNNPYFEYKEFQKEVDIVLNTITYDQIDDWVEWN